MRYGKFLPENGTIGFVAPSFGCNIEPYTTAFQNAQRKWNKMGYQFDQGPNCYEGRGIGISNTPEACGKELTDYYLRTENDCLISCGGGELMCETLDYVDWKAIEDAPAKWYMGFSDNTNMTYLLATMCDTAAIYGPCASAFGMEPWHESLEDAMRVLTGKNAVRSADGWQSLSVSGYPMWERESLKDEEHPLLPYNVTEPRIQRLYDGGWLEGEKAYVQMSGRLLGGCVDCLVNLAGTCFDHTEEFIEKYKEDGIVWFLEACDLNVFGIRRAMWSMEHTGWFKYVKGFIIGRPLCFGQEMMGLDAYQAFLEIAGRKGVPVIMDVDLGHLSPMMPVIVGSYVDVTAKGNDINIEMQLRP